MHVERERLRHTILTMMRGEVVVPLPSLARECHLGVDLGLLDVEPIGAEDLSGGLDESRVLAEAGVDVAPEVQAHGGPDLAARLLPDVRGRVLGEQRRNLGAQSLDLSPREQRGQDEEPVRVEVGELVCREPHQSRIVDAAPGLSR